MRGELQCKALRRREKSRRRRNNGEQWKKQGAEQWKQADIRARADASPGHIDTPQKQSPAAERRRAHTSETRISAIAHPSAERTLKALPLFPQGCQRRPQCALTCDSPAPEGGGAHAPFRVAKSAESLLPLRARLYGLAGAHSFHRQRRLADTEGGVPFLRTRE